MTEEIAPAPFHVHLQGPSGLDQKIEAVEFLLIALQPSGAVRMQSHFGDPARAAGLIELAKIRCVTIPIIAQLQDEAKRSMIGKLKVIGHIPSPNNGS